MEYWSSGKNQGFGIIAPTFYVSGLKTEFLKSGCHLVDQTLFQQGFADVLHLGMFVAAPLRS
ncbi:MAG: hypothetical protein B6D64_06900, partial [Bacteroidetes bacterium 4484_276]